jgi:hypothetical protein
MKKYSTTEWMSDLEYRLLPEIVKRALTEKVPLQEDKVLIDVSDLMRDFKMYTKLKKLFDAGIEEVEIKKRK